MSAGSPMLSVSDLKQFVYCPRIFHFLTVEGLRPPVTALMQRGHRLQEEFERLEPRRVLSRYGFEDARRHFSLALADAELNLTGQVDLLLEAVDRVAVVEFKASGAPLAENHRFQLAAYAMMAERRFRRNCPTAFALFLDREQMEEIAIGPELREAVHAAVNQMRCLLEEGSFPPPTPVRARCINCEFRNFCGDIF